MNLDANLAQLETAQLVRRADDIEITYQFKHALTQDAAYQSLLKNQRSELHRRVAESIEQLYLNHLDENAALLAHHYAEAGDDAKTLTYSVRAGDLAVRQYSYAEARVYYAQALQAITRLPDSVENRRLHTDAILKQMRVTRLSVDPQENLARLKQAEALALLLLEDSQATREDRLRLARTRSWSGTIHVMRNELVEASGELEQALALARELDDRRLETRALFGLAGVITLRGQFGKAVPLLTELLDQYEQVGNWLEWVYALAVLAYSHAIIGDYALGLAEGERAVARARELNNPTRLVEVMGTVMGIYFESGDMQQFLAAAKQTFEAAELSGERVFLFAHVQRALAESRLGNAQTAFERLARDKTRYHGETEQRFFGDWLIAAEAEIALNAGHVEQAILLAEQAVKVALRAGGLFGGGYAERVWGQALARLELPPYNRAEYHFAESVRLFDKGQARLDAARTHVAWGKILRERGDNRAAREHFNKAAAQFKTSGLVRELDEMRKMLAELAL
jgi:tetratricopeptide (TPR) repeat protein